MAKSGLPPIDDLFEAVATASPVSGASGKEAIGAIQDLLRSHAHAGLPNALATAYGTFGDNTKAAIHGFRAANSLPDSEQVDTAMLRALINVAPKNPLASRPYVTLKLDFDWNPTTKLLLLTSIPEGKGAFGAFNPNSDQAGLSFGIIQWAQKPGRLHEILQAFRDSDLAAFTAIFGGGDATVAANLLNHTAKANGGVDPVTGATTDSNFDLVSPAWKARFIAASLSPAFQKVQLTTAQTAFNKSLGFLKGYAPEFTTERAIAFMLDVANQFGDGGAKRLYLATKKDGQTAAQHITNIADESVNRMKLDLRAGVRVRRDQFLNTTLLADA